MCVQMGLIRITFITLFTLVLNIFMNTLDMSVQITLLRKYFATLITIVLHIFINYSSIVFGLFGLWLNYYFVFKYFLLNIIIGDRFIIIGQIPMYIRFSF